MSRFFGFDCTRLSAGEVGQWLRAMRILKARDTLTDGLWGGHADDYYYCHLLAYGDEDAADDARAKLMTLRMDLGMNQLTGERIIPHE